MNAKTIAGWLALAVVIWWVIESPTSAAHVVHNIGTFLSSAGSGITNFFGGMGNPPPKVHGKEMPVWEALLIGVGGFAAIIAVIAGGVRLMNWRAKRKS